MRRLRRSNAEVVEVYIGMRHGMLHWRLEGWKEERNCRCRLYASFGSSKTTYNNCASMLHVSLAMATDHGGQFDRHCSHTSQLGKQPLSKSQSRAAFVCKIRSGLEFVRLDANTCRASRVKRIWDEVVCHES
jgi:hypothetical protein